MWFPSFCCLDLSLINDGEGIAFAPPLPPFNRLDFIDQFFGQGKWNTLLGWVS
jgi:hypothetical protein